MQINTIIFYKYNVNYCHSLHPCNIRAHGFALVNESTRVACGKESTRFAHEKEERFVLVVLEGVNSFARAREITRFVRTMRENLLRSCQDE